MPVIRLLFRHGNLKANTLEENDKPQLGGLNLRVGPAQLDIPISLVGKASLSKTNLTYLLPPSPVPARPTASSIVHACHLSSRLFYPSRAI
ncbi:hypothetical protein J6590_024492 [Homalodisca vitripennis]|nr:hypothetical protein J6590_024492 [Homalodisca vitripennis]